MTNLLFGGTNICRGFSAVEDYGIFLSQQTANDGSSGTAGTQRDASTLLVVGSNLDTVFSVQFNESSVYPGTTITNLTPGVATFSGSQVASWVSNGYAKVQAFNSKLGTRIVSQPVLRTAVGTSNNFVSYQTGSLAADLSAFFDSTISGVTASLSTTSRFSNFATNTRNAALWCKGIVDDTAITRELDTFALNVLIGPHHVLHASHVGCSGQLGWVGSDGVGYVGTVVLPDIQVSGTDIGIAYVRDATSGEIATYNAANPNSQAATQPLSAAFGSSPKIKPFALLPSGTWATSNCQLCLDPNVALLANFVAVPTFHTTKSNCIGIWEIIGAPASRFYSPVTYTNEFQIAQAAHDGRSAFSQYVNVGSTASGDITYTAIPAGTTLATNNASLGAGYPILLGTTHGSPDGYVTFFVPWDAINTTAITTAMQSSAQAAGDPNYASYSPITVSLTGYASY